MASWWLPESSCLLLSCDWRNGQMNEWVDEWMGGWMNGQMNDWIDEWMGRCRVADGNFGPYGQFRTLWSISDPMANLAVEKKQNKVDKGAIKWKKKFSLRLQWWWIENGQCSKFLFKFSSTGSGRNAWPHFGQLEETYVKNHDHGLYECTTIIIIIISSIYKRSFCLS